MNSVFDDLDLNRGVLSRALLHAAGPQLQDFLKAQNASGTLGEIIVTEGCRLKSMFVYHAVTPASYNAQAEKVELCHLGFVFTVFCLALKCGLKMFNFKKFGL